MEESKEALAIKAECFSSSAKQQRALAAYHYDQAAMFEKAAILNEQAARSISRKLIELELDL